jgi:hypothetical protein
MKLGSPCGCRVCGALEIERDEVLDGGVLELAACTRCGHRWTERPLRALALARPLPATDVEVAEAA